MRDSTIFYRSFYEAIKTLNDEQANRVYTAIFELSLNNNLVELDGVENTIFTLIRPQIEANNKKYLNGKQPKKKQNGSKTEAKKKQTKSKTEGNDNDNNKYIIISNKDFQKKVFEFSDKYEKAMLENFISYWTEKNPNGKKHRFEMEKVFDIGRRLATWNKNNQRFNPQSTDDKLVENLIKKGVKL